MSIQIRIRIERNKKGEVIGDAKYFTECYKYKCPYYAIVKTKEICRNVEAELKRFGKYEYVSYLYTNFNQ